MIGQVLAQRYRIDNQLGVGGMGVVYRAYDTRLQREVALKVIAPHLIEQEQATDRFLREAQALAGLTHPNIVTVYDLLEDKESGHVCIVMEILSGFSLRSLLPNDSRPTFHDLATQLCKALEAAHSKGILHRDIKPENIFVCSDGTIKLMDFGLARILSFSATGSVMGTAGYMSPEQIQGRFQDARSDLYALGVVLYEYLLGEPPFIADNPGSLMMLHLSQEPTPLHERSPDIPEALSTIVMRLLKKDPLHRYASAKAVRNALDDMLLRMDVAARPPVTYEEPARVNYQESAVRERSPHIAHILFLTTPDFSDERDYQQLAIRERIQQAVLASNAYMSGGQNAVVNQQSEGVAVLFYDDVIAPARCAVEVARALSQSQGLPIRMGLHSGLVQSQFDLTGRESLVGEGISTAVRIAELGDGGHILLSAQYALWLQQMEEWKPLTHPLLEGSGDQSQPTSIYSLHSKDYGNANRPRKMATQTELKVSLRFQRPSVTPKKIVLLYRRNLKPDENILLFLEEHLKASGHEVFVDRHLKIGVEWANVIEQNIRDADAVIAIVSPKSLQSEMLEFEVETAYDQLSKTGKPSILPVRISSAEPVDGPIGAIINPLNHFLWRDEENNQKLLDEILSAIEEPFKSKGEEIKLEPVGGAVPPDSPFYVVRNTDQEFLTALGNGESILLVKGARQMGKTSLLAQGSQFVRSKEWRCGLTDFQKLTTTQLAQEEVFYKLLAATLARQLRFKYDFEEEWIDIFGANLNMENFLRELLDSSEEPLVWFMDEVDKLFAAPYASDFFGLVRSWHNSRSTEPNGPWNKLTVVISYATEAHLFIQDVNQSPFNVGRRLELKPFTIQQMVDMNGRYGSPLRSYQELEEVYSLIGGQPFLVRRALDALATHKVSFHSLFEEAYRDDGPFSDHLKRILVSVSRLSNVAEYVKSLLAKAPINNPDAYYRLLAAGVIDQTSEGEVDFRCKLYQKYLEQHL